MRIAIGCDHAGFPYKAAVIRALEADGHGLIDVGTTSTDPVDYPDYARLVGGAVRDGAAEVGVLICGSGAGISIAANKIRGVRAALCHDLFTARQSREDDDANVLCLGARVISQDEAIDLARAFVDARFSNAPRHRRRLEKVLELEAEPAAGPPAVAPHDVLALAPVAAALERLERLEAGRRLWAKDPGLWSTDPSERAAIQHRLGWLDTIETMRARLGELHACADEARRDGIADVVLLGMGGSSLAAEMLATTFEPAPGFPRLTVLDTTDPGAIRAVLARITPARTLFLVSSKSGTTLEMLALYRLMRAELERPEAGVPEPGRHFVAITDAGTPLERLAAEARFRRTFVNASDIGGRFSALSCFGLVPGALLGLDLTALLERAAAMAAACGPGVAPRDNPGLRLGAILGGLGLAGRDKVTLVVSPALASLGAWLEQLITESTGKSGKGFVLVNEEPLGPPEVYGADRVFVGITLGGAPDVEATLGRLEAAGHPVVRLRMGDRLELGAEIFRWELATATAGTILEINPFDEPNVSQAKAATQAALGSFRESGRLPDWPAETAEDLARTLARAKAGDYVALLAYVTPTPDTTAALQRLRVLIRDCTHLATTVGYGPRYLHSTGQLHKGGPPTPIAVIFAAEDAGDLPIPGERHGFGTLKMAQALGDLATLREAHRRALWMPLAGPPAEAIAQLAAALGKGLS
ncbi:MAG: ribose 5-phosphate isomerase B [Candidatus Rokubacteria bacterium]|nr:ribose 5-phosphate isomerase B [Candidatus Rokubacteria bacterium]